ncbi:hypothetical protein SDC9_210460 [bioreactor metagenome]|uniref:Uncharacterized protein n=1 Tax=bioreactor metagenome TaxID=1076179 RepID=A0A645JH89_9ZZZZ
MRVQLDGGDMAHLIGAVVHGVKRNGQDVAVQAGGVLDGVGHDPLVFPEVKIIGAMLCLEDACDILVDQMQVGHTFRFRKHGFNAAQQDGVVGG